ncbi:hypothetical protein E1264_03145 [Actinomadura sp. KC216]|uniref:hypothetical protein n=1 Tax=Actinomadura sp. KC216 TaxID=2530370 RepID=UPI00104A833C|nr:hypothetical protein [Actinomadura sp. KC216]TDB91009.1 hypothetical protein E1264_03145 [Actinomadura sp. KC216]
MDHDHSPGTLLRLRRGAHEFLRRYAATAWEHKHEGERWDLVLPPEVAKLPERKRYRAHARQEAQRLKDAALYDLDPDTTRRAIQVGAAIREHRHNDVTALAGRSDVIDTMDIQPPSLAGFLRWRDPSGISYNARGVPIVACHWGPAADQGIWIVWWADSRAVIKSYGHEIKGTWAESVVNVGTALPFFGPLWYSEQQLIWPYSVSAPKSTARGTPIRPTAPAGDTAAEPVPVDDDFVALLYTTLATWSLLADPPTGIHLQQHPPSEAEQTADRNVGLATPPITIATTVKTTH